MSKCWSGHVSSSLWSNVSKVASLCSVSKIKRCVTQWLTDWLTQWQCHLLSCQTLEHHYCAKWGGTGVYVVPIWSYPTLLNEEISIVYDEHLCACTLYSENSSWKRFRQWRRPRRSTPERKIGKVSTCWFMLCISINLSLAYFWIRYLSEPTSVKEGAARHPGEKDWQSFHLGFYVLS